MTDWNASRIALSVLGRRLPRTEGSTFVEGLKSEIEIGRDEHSIPYIRASNEPDMWFGLGFCHGQDRGGQVNLLYQLCRGQICEAVGEEMLEADRLARRIGFIRNGKTKWPDDPALVDQFESYIAGVNAGFRDCHAHEYTLLGVKPIVPSVDDAMALMVLLSFMLASNWDMELLRFKVLAMDGPEALRAIDPAYAAHLPVSCPPGARSESKSAQMLADDIAKFLELVGRHTGGGSNAWAVAGSRSATKRPLLASDPHLATQIPSNMYLCRLECPTVTLVGASFLGAPCLLSGHNGHVAWGMTAAHADNVDLFLEKLSPDGTKCMEYDKDGKKHWVPCEVREEKIYMKGRKEPHIERVTITPRGPVISPALLDDPFENTTDNAMGNAISMSATYFEARPSIGPLRHHMAKTIDEFRGYYKHCAAGCSAIIVADTAGSIGFFVGAEVPDRLSGSGLLPMPGWRPECGWKPDLITTESLPYLKNPACGYVATCNNQPESYSKPDAPFLGADFLDGYRMKTVVRTLKSRANWDVADFAALQRDTKSMPWTEMRETILSVPPRGHPLEAEAEFAQLMLLQWDGHVSATSSAATVYEFFVTGMVRRMYTSKAPRSVEWALGKGMTVLLPASMARTRHLPHLISLLQLQPDGWFEYGWKYEILECLGSTIVKLRKDFGTNPAAWAWGKVRPLTLEHPFGANGGVMGNIFNAGPFYGEGGDGTTISVLGLDFNNPLANPWNFAQVRMVMDVGDWDRSRFCLAGGQSGNPVSAHYVDQMDVWRKGIGFPIPYTGRAAEARVQKRLILKPPRQRSGSAPEPKRRSTRKKPVAGKSQRPRFHAPD